jgi:hypothetical protein
MLSRDNTGPKPWSHCEPYQPTSPDGRAPRTMGFSGLLKSLVMGDLILTSPRKMARR